MKSIYSIDNIFIFPDRLEAKSVFGNTKKIIFLDDILTWTEIKRKTKYSTWTDLTVYTENTEFGFSSFLYKNYWELKSALTKDKKKDIEKEKASGRNSGLYVAAGITIVGGLILCIAFNIYATKDDVLSPSDLQTISGIISNEAKIKKGSKGDRSITIKLNSYPAFDFYLSGSNYKATYATDYESNITTGDSLYLDILKEEYQMITTDAKTAVQREVTEKNDKIDVYGLRDKNGSFLKLSDYIEEDKSNSTGMIWLLGILGLIFLGIGGLFFVGIKTGGITFSNE